MPTVEEVLSVEEGVVYQGESETITRSVTVRGAVSISGVTVAVYDKSGNDTTVANMPTGSPTAAGNVITLPPITALSEILSPYASVITATVDGNVETITLVYVAFEEKSLWRRVT